MSGNDMLIHPTSTQKRNRKGKETTLGKQLIMNLVLTWEIWILGPRATLPGLLFCLTPFLLSWSSIHLWPQRHCLHHNYQHPSIQVSSRLWNLACLLRKWTAHTRRWGNWGLSHTAYIFKRRFEVILFALRSKTQCSERWKTYPVYLTKDVADDKDPWQMKPVSL